jgi:tRNA-dihydrouridine synthase B
MPEEKHFLKDIHLPNLTVRGNILLAPMAGYSDAAFRSLCLEHGAALCFTEMVSAEALSRGSMKTLELLKRAENETSLAVQIFAGRPHTAARAVRILSAYKPDLIDLNCGCSVPKILKSGCGAVLLKTPAVIKEIVHAMREETDACVSVKLRSGWDHESINYLAAAEAALKGGACLVSLHPRTRAQGFRETAALSHLSDLKAKISVPVLGSGDLFSAAGALKMLSETGCDGIMFARGALGNPFIFAQTRALAQGRCYPARTSGEKLSAALRQLSLAVRFQGEAKACREMRKHFCAYTKGIPRGAALRRRIVHAASEAEYRRLVQEYLSYGE